MILWTVILWRLEAGLGRSGNGNRRQQRQVDLVSHSDVGLALTDVGLARSWVRTQGLSRSRLALCLSSLSVTASRRHRCLFVSLRLALSLVTLASRSLTFLSSFFFLFFPLVFAFSVWFWTAEGWDFFFFFFFVVLDLHGLWPYGLCSELAGWWARGKGARAKISGGPKPLFFFFGKILLAKFFFFGPRGGSGPFSLVPGSVPDLSNGWAEGRPQPETECSLLEGSRAMD